jgi:hypothetical protein
MFASHQGETTQRTQASQSQLKGCWFGNGQNARHHKGAEVLGVATRRTPIWCLNAGHRSPQGHKWLAQELLNLLRKAMLHRSPKGS